MWRHLRDLLTRLSKVLDGNAVMADGLDTIAELLGADRGVVFLVQEDGVLQPVMGRREGRAADPLEREEISRTIVSQALETDHFVRFDPAADTLTRSTKSLGIVGALAAPLSTATSSVRGVLYVDFRDRRRIIDEHHVDFFLTAATVFGLALEQHARRQEVREQLEEARANCVEARRPVSYNDLLGFPSLAALRKEVQIAIASPAPILVLGESGSGKTMLAHVIAEHANRRPVVRVMLGASDDLNTITSELFGHERGAYSGANSRRVGLVEFAHGGTLVLDELLNFPIDAQKLFLDFLQFGSFRPLGYDKAEPKKSDVRIIAATNGNPMAAIREGRLREDLYHRIAHFVLEMPPLRERREDIPVLAERVLRRVDPSRTWTFSLELRQLLVSPKLTWPGNVRQLERVIERARERAVASAPAGTTLTPEHLDARDLGSTAVVPRPPRSSGDAPGTRWQALQSERANLDDEETMLIRETLAACDGVVTYAARELGVARTTLSSRIDALGIRSRPSKG
ncbi:MAG: sigma-54-dependent Fis family transcriptional regulator [Myxococcales bacterium]|nr:sigma-54-dependent Fis family transcriptional regulator [Myxococcales bacterium]